MSQKVSDLRTPSGKVVKFVAKRGEIGVMMALADAGYDMDQLKKVSGPPDGWPIKDRS